MFLTVVSEIGRDHHITQHDVASAGAAVQAHLRTRGLDPFYDAGYDDGDIERVAGMTISDADRGFVNGRRLKSVWIWTTNTIFPDFPAPISITVVKTDHQ